ncbi:UbiA family prenyltransferase [Nanoarchaeota archaeon]
MVGWKFFRGFWRLIRPYWWGKTFFFITFGAAMAVGGLPDIGLLLLGTLIIAPLLYGALYTLNDFSDIKVDRLDSEKKNRAFASGMISPTQGLILAFLLILIALISGFFINKIFFYILLLMLVNQIVYSFKPTRLKKVAFFDVFSAVFVSSGSKFLAGWFLFTNSFNIPWLPLIGILAVQSGGFLLYKLRYNKTIDMKLGNKTTVAVLPERLIKILAKTFFVIGFLSFVFLPLNSVMFEGLNFLGVLPLKFLWLIILGLVLGVFYWRLFKKKKGVFKVQTQLYLSYFILAILFLITYYF